MKITAALATLGLAVGGVALAPAATATEQAGGNDIVGSPRSDVLIGTKGDDHIAGRAGFDLLVGRDGNDTLDGGPGRDTLRGGPGQDVLIGGSGRDTYVFSGDPFNGTPVDTTDGERAIVNTPDSTPDFDPRRDNLVARFGIERPRTFVNGTLEELQAAAASGVRANTVVIQGTGDADIDDGDVFLAGTAATAIAKSGVAAPGPGVFVYWNSNLQINRLVYSSDLSDPTADISILLNVDTVTGEQALDVLPHYRADTFRR